MNPIRVLTRPFRLAAVGVVAGLLASSLALADAAPAKPTSQMQAVLDAHAKLGPKPIVDLAPADARRQPSASDAVIQLMQDKGTAMPDKLPPVGRVETKAIAGPDGQPLPLRVFTPKGDGPFPVIVYFHGGGWVIATNDTYESSMRALCSMAGAVIVSPEYRKAPEHKFPAAHEDCYATLQYVAGHADEFGGDAKKVAVVGESAGGNMATAVCLMAQQRGGKMPIHQVLIYPVTQPRLDTPSYLENADAKPLNKPMMAWFFKQYLNSDDNANSVLVSPLSATPAELKGLPPATVITAQIDPLRSDGELYAKKLADAGVEVKAKTYDGVTHEFFGMGLVVDQAMDAETQVADRLKEAFKAAK